jgi:hypothetical protein
MRQWHRLAVVTAIAAGAFGCKNLEVTNPNAPDAATSFSDPAAVAGLVTGAMRTWYNTRGAYYGGMVLAVMADSYTASYNNAQMRYYSSNGPIGSFEAECRERCGWVNIQSSPRYPPLEPFWYGYYGMLSSVNDALRVFRRADNPVVISDAATTKMHESISVMIQGVVFANIAMNYDKGFIIDEQTDLSNPAALPYASRKEMRDAAIAKFNDAYALLGTSPFAASPSTWTFGWRYSSAQYQKLIRTMQAELLTNWPRNAAETATVPWAQVATYAAQGISSGTAFDLNFEQDFSTIFDNVKGNGISFMRVDTRFGNLITGGYPPAMGSGPVYRKLYTSEEAQPNSADARLGNGTWGPEDDVIGSNTIAADAGAGTDYAYSPYEPFRVSRGAYNQTSLMHIRYSHLASPGSGLPGETGRGTNDFYKASNSDLLWAEGLIRGGGSAATAAALINKTRVGRGHLAPLTGAESQSTLLLALQYEQEVEEMGQAQFPFFNRRRVTPGGYKNTDPCPTAAPATAILCLWESSPREMPVPAKELGVLVQPLYSWGGDDLPANSPTPAPQASSLLASASLFSSEHLNARVPQRELLRATRGRRQ